jgi:hypothetical protein
VVVQFEIMECPAEHVRRFVLEVEHERGEHLREFCQLFRLVAFHDLQVALFALIELCPVDAVAQRDRRHFDEIAEDLPDVMAVAEPINHFDDLTLRIRTGWRLRLPAHGESPLDGRRAHRRLSGARRVALDNADHRG